MWTAVNNFPDISREKRETMDARISLVDGDKLMIKNVLDTDAAVRGSRWKTWI